MEFAFWEELLIIFDNSSFLNHRNIAIYPPEIVISCFFYGIRILGGTFDNLLFVFPILYYLN
jgi:hypothetical protein